MPSSGLHLHASTKEFFVTPMGRPIANLLEGSIGTVAAQQADTDFDKNPRRSTKTSAQEARWCVISREAGTSTHQIRRETLSLISAAAFPLGRRCNAARAHVPFVPRAPMRPIPDAINLIGKAFEDNVSIPVDVERDRAAKPNPNLSNPIVRHLGASNGGAIAKDSGLRSSMWRHVRLRSPR
jgi:hypothetical protein